MRNKQQQSHMKGYKQYLKIGQLGMDKGGCVLGLEQENTPTRLTEIFKSKTKLGLKHILAQIFLKRVQTSAKGIRITQYHPKA